MLAATDLVTGLEASAAKHPLRPALIDGTLSLSYRDLLERSFALHRHLASLGVQRGDRVAIALENSWQYVASIYAAWMAGAIAVPLNATARAAEILGWVTHSGAVALVIDGSRRDLVDLRNRLDASLHLLTTGTDGAVEGACATPAAPKSRTPLQSEDPATIQYTSGTTGDPKGVLLSHGNLASNTHSILDYLGLTADDSVVSILPFYYAYGSSVLHTHLQSGGTLVLERGFVYPHRVVETMAKNRTTGFAGVPSTFSLLLSRVNLSDFDLSALRYVTQAGGAMPPAVTLRLMAALPSACVYVMYGQTEATSRLTYLPPELLREKAGSVGKPVKGVRLEVRDETGLCCPIGEGGHIWANGPNVMLGYWNNPEATARVLVNGWLDTGDIGRFDEDGFLYLEGRRSDIIKVGAHRVHPQDVENVIAELPAVAEVAVAGADDAVLGEVVHAFVVPKQGGGVTEQAVKRHCLDRLSAYKVPKVVVMVSALPRTASGKVRRRELVSRGIE
jgi:acyl-CoA synthetase (AMP-forming)/AMP-acid ligase II